MKARELGHESYKISQIASRTEWHVRREQEGTIYGMIPSLLKFDFYSIIYLKYTNICLSDREYTV